MRMKANFETIKLMEKEFIIAMMEMYTLVFGEAINNKAKAMKNSKTDLSTKEHIKMEKRMDMVFINGEMDVCMKEILNKTVFTVKEYITGIHKSTMDNGFIP